MAELPENKELMLLSRKYADYEIDREEFRERRRKILDEIDACYNNKSFAVSDMAKGIKSKLEEALAYLKKNQNRE